MTFKKDPIVSVQGIPVLLFTKQHKTLLDGLEFKKIAVYAECRGGFCGACKTKIISGCVSYIQVPLVALAKDECLPCCCIPKENLDLALGPQSNKVDSTSIQAC